MLNACMNSMVNLDFFANIVKSSKTMEEAFKYVSQIKDVPSEIAWKFKEKYDPTNILSPRLAFMRFYKDVKKNSYGVEVPYSIEDIDD